MFFFFSIKTPSVISLGSLEVQTSKTDMLLYADDPAPWNKEEKSGVRLVGVYEAEISLEEEIDFKTGVDGSWYIDPPVDLWRT